MSQPFDPYRTATGQDQPVAAQQAAPVQNQPEAAPRPQDGVYVPPERPQIAEPTPEQSGPEVTDGDDFSHYIHLADGRVIKARLDEHPVGDMFTENADSDHPTMTRVIGVYPR
jgi:hypothetical protein